MQKNKRQHGGGRQSFKDEVDLVLFVHLPTCDEQRVHARRRLGGLEHLADVLLGEGGLSPALPLGVLLLPPLEVLLGDGRRVASKEGEREGGRREGGTRRCVQRHRIETRKEGEM